MFDLLIIGEINPDIILRGDDVTPVFGQVEKMVESADLTIGSSSVITACGAARLGLKVAFVGVVGDDVNGRFVIWQRRVNPRGQHFDARYKRCIGEQDVITGED